MDTIFTQAEQDLENELVSQLIGQGYSQVAVTDEATMLANLKAQKLSQAAWLKAKIQEEPYEQKAFVLP